MCEISAKWILSGLFFQKLKAFIRHYFFAVPQLTVFDLLSLWLHYLHFITTNATRSYQGSRSLDSRLLQTSFSRILISLWLKVKRLKIAESIKVVMQPVTKQFLSGLSTVGVPVRRMQKTCPLGHPIAVQGGQTD